MNTHTTKAWSFAAAAAGIACFAMAGCGAQAAPQQDIGIVAPHESAGSIWRSADSAERAGQQDQGYPREIHKQPPDARP